MYTIVFEYDGEPHKRRMASFGVYPTYEAGFDDLPRHVREHIESPDDDEQVHTADELLAEVARISMSGDGDAFGFRVYIAPLNLDEQHRWWIVQRWDENQSQTVCEGVYPSQQTADNAMRAIGMTIAERSGRVVSACADGDGILIHDPSYSADEGYEPTDDERHHWLWIQSVAPQTWSPNPDQG